MISSATIEDIIDKIQILSIVPPPRLDPRISSQKILKFRHCGNSVIARSEWDEAISFKIPSKIPSLRGRILNFSGVLGAPRV